MNYTRLPAHRPLAALLVGALALLCVIVGSEPGFRLAGSLLQQVIPGEERPFPLLERTVFPVSATPDWGNMHGAAQWNRSYDQIPVSEFVAVPEYRPEELTESYKALAARPTAENRERIMRKLFYSTRHMGQYHVDSAEYAGTHNGVDLKLAKGTPVSAIAGGRVLEAGWAGQFGKRVMVEHRAADGNRFVSIYAHLKDIEVKPGQDLRPGDLVGTVGTTGRTTGPHLHLQVDVWPLDQDEFKPFVAKRRMAPEEVAEKAVNPILFIDHYENGEVPVTVGK